MSSIAQHAKAIFLQAVEKHAPEEWPQFLEEACGNDQELRQRVEGLLQAHQDKDSLFDRVPPTRGHEPCEQVGQMIGPYKLRECLGEGGMGVVWAAEQKQPLRRKVALKVIKPGMDSAAIIARFDVEREALALMDHPNIARVYDAGTTEQGRPYFVMELIRGVPITEYCDVHKLTVRERLDLFVQICWAVQHAHQKGVIHRDLKPLNVLVTEQDGKPVPKIIDFGVAKALYHPLTEKSVYTGVFQAIGTLAYMSPEQATLSAVDVDTRSDVYGLGVLLYELLTGATPFDRQQLERAAIDEACRLIREIDPPRPSTRVTTLGERANKVSLGRRTDTKKLLKALQGDLDWIVMKALDKERSRRYETANGLAEDITRHLNDEEVQARPPSARYRMTRFVRRNRSAVAIAGLALMALIASTGFGWMSYIIAIGELEYQQRERLVVLADVAGKKEEVGNHEEAIDDYRELVDLHQRLLGEHDVATLQSQTLLAGCLAKSGRLIEATSLFDSTLTALSRIPDLDTQEIGSAALLFRDSVVNGVGTHLSSSHADVSDTQVILKLAKRAAVLTDQYNLDPSPVVSRTLARAQLRAKDYEGCIATCETLLSSRLRGAAHPSYLLLAVASALAGKSEPACDWLAAADNAWIGSTVKTRDARKMTRHEVQRLIADSGGQPLNDLTVEDEERLYQRILTRVPEAHEVRRYHAYCLFQLGRWQEADREISILTENGERDPYALSGGATMDLFFNRGAGLFTRAEDLKKEADDMEGQNMGTLSIATMLRDREGKLADDTFYVHSLSGSFVATALIAYRMGRFDEAMQMVDTHGGAFPARHALAEVIRALVHWERGEESQAREALSRAEEQMERLAPRDGVARTNKNVSYFTSVIWLEPILLMREARLKIPPLANE